jgi:hypothetical protein
MQTHICLTVCISIRIAFEKEELAMKTRRIYFAPGDWSRFQEFAKELGLTLQELAVRAVNGGKGVKS